MIVMFERTKISGSRTVLSTLLLTVLATCSAALAGDRALPVRSGPPVHTTSGVPHIQLGLDLIPEVHAELMRRVAALPDLDIRPTVVSLPGATGFWLSERIELKRPDVIVGGREFAHIHPDGSIHASLPPDRALEAVETGWAARHPWADQRPGWEGFVMLFTPQTRPEADVIFELIVDGYNFVTGRNLLAVTFHDR